MPKRVSAFEPTFPVKGGLIERAQIADCFRVPWRRSRAGSRARNRLRLSAISGPSEARLTLTLNLDPDTLFHFG
jgi:hypothetical protein